MKALKLILLCTPLLGGCVIAAGAGIGYVLSERALKDGSLEARVQDEVKPVWDVARESMGILIDPASELKIQLNPRIVSGTINLDCFEVEVQAYDFKDTLIIVRSDALIGIERRRKVLNYILERLSKARAEAPPSSGASLQLRGSVGKSY